jgi:REP element-mobilizing transposase RayT
MYHNRIKRQPVERTLYLITNRITGGSMIFGDQEKEKFRRLLFEGEKRCSYQVWDYVVMGNHYHALIYIPQAEDMSRAEVLRRWQEAEVAVNRPGPDDPSEETLDAHRRKIHDISFVVGNFQQRFTQWYNKCNERWGKLFGGRFDSVLLDEQGAVARVMAYITLNAVRARLVDDPAEYQWCGYAERMAKEQLRDNDRDLAVYLQRELGMSDGMVQGTNKAVMKRVWKRFRERLLGSRVRRGDGSRETIAALLDAAKQATGPELAGATTIESKIRNERHRTRLAGVCKRCAGGILWAFGLPSQARGPASTHLGRGLLPQETQKVDRLRTSRVSRNFVFAG